MKIRTKLLMTFTIFIFLIFFLIWMGKMQIDSFRKKYEGLRENYNALMMTESILINIKNRAISMRNVILFDDDELTSIEMAAIKEYDAAISHDIYSLEPLFYTKHPEYIENLRKAVIEINAYNNQIISLVNEGKKEEAIGIIKRDWQRLSDEVVQAVSAIADVYEKETEVSIDDTVNEFAKSISGGNALTIVAIIIVSGITLLIIWNLMVRLQKVNTVMVNIANGSVPLSQRIETKSIDEIDDICNSFNQMAQSLENQMTRQQEHSWVKSNVAEITKRLNDISDMQALLQAFLSQLAPLLEAAHAVFYVKDDNEPRFKLLASYAFKERKHIHNQFGLGEGLIGQAALEKSPIILTNVPQDYIQIRSGLGEAAPQNVYVLPVKYKEQVQGVVEIASFKPFTHAQQSLLEEMVEYMGILLDNVKSSKRLADLLQQSQAQLEEIQAQSEELQSQQEELRCANEELEKQTEALRQSKEELQSQQEELEQTNEELRGKMEALEVQNKKLEAANNEIAAARAELEEKARQLALSSRYKSEFLANMSHELRTPLNSLIILSKLLADNPDGNLTEKQIEFSKTIHSSGCDLLNTINDILDLSKIESGKTDIHPGKVFIKDLAAAVEKNFIPIAQEKNLGFEVVLDEGLPQQIYSDAQRIQQVLTNLLSNAFKFTHQGKVTLKISPSGKADGMTCFAVSDTGIGIPEDKLELIFQAFQQADGTTSRKYGGTGLGLSISREIANLLGGEISVTSRVGEGSTFTFCVGNYKDHREHEVAATAEDVSNTSSAEPVKIPVAKPKQERQKEKNSRIKSILIVDDDLMQRNSLMELMGDKDVVIKAVSTGAEAIEQLKVSRFDCIILDLGLADISGFDILDRIDKANLKDDMKIIIYTGRDLTTKEELYLKKYAHTIIIKDAQASQRLLDELELYLPSAGGREASDDNVEAQTGAVKPEAALEGKKVLIVDDDARNVFALSSALETCGMTVTFAENGIEALEVLKEESDFDLILMDIMMPVMDGFEAMSKIRMMPLYRNIPIIALTAKAMKEDREKCIEAGASDYIAKPVNTDQLISLMKVWLYREDGVIM